MTKRFLVLVVGAFVAMWPMGASAATNDQVIAQQKALSMAASTQANLLNDIARCQLALANVVSVPGNTSNCSAVLASASTNIRASQSSMSATPGAVSSACTVTGTMTAIQMAVLNDFLIAKAKAEGSSMPAPTPSLEVMGLLAC